MKRTVRCEVLKATDSRIVYLRWICMALSANIRSSIQFACHSHSLVHLWSFLMYIITWCWVLVYSIYAVDRWAYTYIYILSKTLFITATITFTKRENWFQIGAHASLSVFSVVVVVGGFYACIAVQYIKCVGTRLTTAHVLMHSHCILL